MSRAAGLHGAGPDGLGRAGLGMARSGGLGWWSGVLLAVVVAVVGCGEQAARTEAPTAAVPAVTGGSAELPDAEVDPSNGVALPGAGPGSVDGAGLPDAGSDLGNGSQTSGGVEDAAGGAGTPEPVADGAQAADQGTGSGEGAVVPEAGGDAAGPGDAGGSLGPAVDASQPADGSQSSAPDTAGDDAGDGAAADLPGPLSFQYEPGGLFFELGFREFWPDRYDLDVFSDEVAVRTDSVLVAGGVVRGLVQNMSQRLFARHVTVLVGDGMWVFPLTVQPTEVVPFEIEGYEGPSDPESISFEVSAQLAPEPDPRRSFDVTESPGLWSEPWWELRDGVPDLLGEAPPEGTSRDSWVSYYETLVELRAPSSHPSVAEGVKSQMIEDLRVYLTEMDADGRVLDVRELVPFNRVIIGFRSDGGSVTEPAPVHRLPWEDGDTSFWVAFLPDSPQFGITVGGAHDGAE